jgi:hypothetical protein
MKPVKNYEQRYSITEDGRLYSHLSKKFLKTTVHKTGYEGMCTRVGSRHAPAVLFRIHRLVAEAYIPNPENKTQVNHIDGDKLNNHVSNLEWVTPSENIIHAYAMGLAHASCGTKNGQSKLTEHDIQSIRATYVPYCRINGARALAKIFNVHHTIISRVAGNNKRRSYQKI